MGPVRRRRLCASRRTHRIEIGRPTVPSWRAARFAKNRRTKVQPLAADVAEALRDYLDGKPAAALVWGGTGRGKAAEMLRADLEAVGIPYAVEGPDGPEHADSHALRHSFLTLGGRSGIDLRTLQELAGHSTPTLTARYMHVRLRDAAGAVDRMPNLVPIAGPTVDAAAIPLRMTGTEGANTDNLVRSGVVPGVVTGGAEGHQSASSGTIRVVGGKSDDVSQPLEMQGAGTSQHRPASPGIASSKWAVPGLNRGPSDFQSLALPTELTAHCRKIANRIARNRGGERVPPRLRLFHPASHSQPPRFSGPARDRPASEREDQPRMRNVMRPLVRS